MDANGRWTFIPLELITAVGCCLGNVMVIWAVWTCGALRKPTFCFITSLAVADFLVGVVVIPLAVLVRIQLRISFHTCLFMCCVILMVKIVSVALLLAIAVDRFLRVYIPLRYKSTVTQKCSWTVVALCWFFAALWGFTPMFGWHENPTSSPFECSFLTVIPASYLVNFILLSSLLPSLAIMTGMYCYIFLITRKQLRAHISENTVSNTDYHKEHRLATSLALVMVLFYVCWLPIFFVHTVKLHFQTQASFAATHICVLLSHINSAANPIVYAFRISKIKQAYEKLWGRFHCGADIQQGSEQRDADSSRNINAKNIMQKMTHE